MSEPIVHLLASVPGLATPYGYSYAASARGELVFFSGQVAFNADGNLVGQSDFAAQVRQVFANLQLVLAAEGCSPASVVRITYYVVGPARERLLVVRAARDEVFGAHKPAATLLGVAALSHPDMMFEVDAVAVRAP
jgi:enamine deaminase RidA (YjgF/YER057c/UK114 family)